MKRTPLFCAMAVATLLSGPAEAIYKCTTPKGVIYQDRPCREGTESDVQIVISTGEVMAKPVATPDDSAAANTPRSENRAVVTRSGRGYIDDSANAAKAAERRATNETLGLSSEEARRKDARPSPENTVPMTADQARKTEPTAKYYTTDAAAPGAEVPEQMTCESPSGEKRRFILTNGKLTSI